MPWAERNRIFRATDHPARLNDLRQAAVSILRTLGIGHRVIQNRHQFRRGESEHFPEYRFRTLGFDYAATVFSINDRRRSPLSPVDGKPMPRASIQEVETLLK